MQGRPVSEVLQSFLANGVDLLYSSRLVTPRMRVLKEPLSPDPIAQIGEILAPYNLMLRRSGDRYLVVKAPAEGTTGDAAALYVLVNDAQSLSSLDNLIVTLAPAGPEQQSYASDFLAFSPLKPGDYAVVASLTGYTTRNYTIHLEPGETKLLSIDFELGPAELEDVNVSTSRYVLYSNSEFFIDQEAIQALPELGDDPVRAVQRLQGTAASGVSSMSHIRGGLKNENSIYLNGLKLLEPYHVRDYHSVFSFIDSQAISGIQAYTGAFPAAYGDAMSGVLLLDSAAPERPLHTSLGASFYNTSVLNSGHSSGERVDWLFAARRSNVDLVLDDEYGEPNYFDVFSTLGIDLGGDSRLTLNALWARDDLSIITETKPQALEQSVSKTHNLAVWVSFDHDWGNGLSSLTIFSVNDFSNRRRATIDEPLEMISDVSDYREAHIVRLRQAMAYDGFAGHSIQWGLEASRQRADYRYAGGAEYFGFTATYPGLLNPNAYQLETRPSGYTYGVFASDRISLGSKLSLELGARWDRQTYTEPVYSSQFSPRLGLAWAPGDGRVFRFSMGRYYQSQNIAELQVEDDVDAFYRPQRADHFIAGYQWNSNERYQFRLEAYLKNYRHVASRFENLFDPLQLIPEFQPDRIRLDPSSAKAFGVELGVEYTGSEYLSWWVSWSLSRVTDSINGNSERRDWDQLNALQLGLAWRKGPWEVGIASRIHTGWPQTPLTLGYDAESGSYYPIPGPRNSEKFNVFYTLDFRVSRHFDVHHGELTGWVEVTNTTDRKNLCCVNYRGVEFSDGQTVLRENSEYWLPIIPAIGLLWEF